MKATWDEGKGAKADWMPPFTEWDFRTIKESESRPACGWEYARNSGVICNNVPHWLQGAGSITELSNYICAEGSRFPEPWIMAGDEVAALAAEVAEEESPITVYPLKAWKEYVMREVAAAQRDGADVLVELDRLLLSDGYVMTVGFEAWGCHAVGDALTQWARQEAKKFPRVRRGKGAAPPFEWLKWLAALRLESARQEAGVSFAEVQAALAEHQREYPITDGSPTLPLYASHGAWSKAISDARKCLALLESEPLNFEKRILLF